MMNRRKRPDKRKNAGKKPGKEHKVNQSAHLKDEIRINKYIAHAGFCSRRDADEYIGQGKVFVNGKRVIEHGVKVKKTDKVTVDGQLVSLEPFVYILLNKSKDTISTTDDEKDRNTVLDVVEDATGYRVYPVGRLDRDTMGLLLLTNDGDLAHRLMHPSYKVKKVYEVAVKVPLTDSQLRELIHGIQLEDGPAKPHLVQRSVLDPSVLEITVFEGRNHLIRRMIQYFGTEVVKLKRVRYGGLDDKDLRVGRWRYLKQKEINDLRRMVKLKPLDFKKEGL
jgi:23S rRNA pseudouridine2605 synthase